MRTVIFLLALMASTSLLSQKWSDKTRVLPDELRKIPVAIYIMHGPNPNYPEIASDIDSTEFKYVWKHFSSIISPEKNLQVIKAGSYIWYNEEGWKNNAHYNRRGFARRFNCPKGKLEAGKTYTFEKNYRYGNSLYGGDALWYVLAKDDEGNIYKGTGLIETESELITKKI